MEEITKFCIARTCKMHKFNAIAISMYTFYVCITFLGFSIIGGYWSRRHIHAVGKHLRKNLFLAKPLPGEISKNTKEKSYFAETLSVRPGTCGIYVNSIRMKEKWEYMAQAYPHLPTIYTLHILLHIHSSYRVVCLKFGHTTKSLEFYI